MTCVSVFIFAFESVWHRVYETRRHPHLHQISFSPSGSFVCEWVSRLQAPLQSIREGHRATAQCLLISQTHANTQRIGGGGGRVLYSIILQQDAHDRVETTSWNRDEQRKENMMFTSPQKQSQKLGLWWKNPDNDIEETDRYGDLPSMQPEHLQKKTPTSLN